MIKKSKFAAIALSVVMAVSVMPSAVLAAETDAVETSKTYRYQRDTVEWSYDSETGKCTVSYTEVNVDDSDDYKIVEYEVTDKKEAPATCTKGATVVFTTTIDGVVENSDEFFTSKPLDHDWKEIKRTPIASDMADCTKTGSATIVEKCERCGEERESVVETDKTDHDWSAVKYRALENIATDKKGNPIFENGEAVLIDPAMDGYYETYVECKVCGELDQEEGHVVLAKDIDHAEVVATKGIANGVAVGDKFVGPVAEEKIELENCLKAGSYTVRFYTKDNKIVNERVYDVAPHHYGIVTAIEFADKNEALQCIVKQEKDGSWTVKNMSCYLPVTYYEAEHCTAAGCPNKACNDKKAVWYMADGSVVTEEAPHTHFVTRTAKTAEPVGPHSIDTEAQKEIASLQQQEWYRVDYATQTRELVTGVTYYELKDKFDKYVSSKEPDCNVYVNIKNNTSTCTEDGTVDVEYICKVCKEVVLTETINVVAPGHKALPPKAENVVAPTCTAEGHYDANVYCEYCGELLKSRPMIIPMAKHTNEISKGVDDTTTDTKAKVGYEGEVVVDDKSALYDKFAAGQKITDADYDAVVRTITQAYGKEYTVDAYAYTLCDTCGGHKVVLDKDAEIEVLEVIRPSKVDSAFKAGSITLRATYTKADGKTKVVETQSFPYYSTIDEYRGRTDYQPVDPTPVEPEQPEALAAVTGLKAETIGMNRVKLTWDAVEGANGYLIIGLNPTRTGSQIAYTARTTWTDTAADSEEFNYYWVIAYNTESKAKGELGGYVWALGRVVGKVTRVAAVATENGIELDWADVTGANSYVILSKTGSNDADFNAPVAVEESDYVDAGVAAGTVKFYWVYGTYTNEDGKTLAAGKTSPFAWAQAE